MGGALLFAALVMLLLGIIGLIKPIPKLGIPTRKRGALSVLTALVLMPVSASMLPASPSGPSQPAKTVSAAVAEVKTPVGTPQTIEDSVFTIEKVMTRQRVGVEYGYEYASEGGVLVVVESAVKNSGNKPIAAYRIPRVEALVAPDGTRYKPDVGKSAAYQWADELGPKRLDSKSWSDLNPGITVRDAQVFEVATDQYDAATWHAVVDGNEFALK